MILSKRERLILVLVLVVIGIFLIDYVALTPLLERRAKLRGDAERLAVELAADRALSDDRDRLDRRWQEVVLSGLHADASAAEGEVLAALRSWARESRLTLDNFAPGRGERVEVNEKGEKLDPSRQFNRLVVTASGTGSMASVRDFLWRIRNAQIPVRVTELTLQSRKEGTDDLSIQIGVSTLYMPPEAATGTPKADTKGDSTRAEVTRTEGQRGDSPRSDSDRRDSRSDSDRRDSRSDPSRSDPWRSDSPRGDSPRSTTTPTTRPESTATVRGGGE